jgi:hypothetical protein
MITFKSIYVAQARSGVIKIGASNEPEARMLELSTDAREPVLLLHKSEQFCDWTDREAKAFYDLRRRRLCGEWFVVTPETAIDVVKLVSTSAWRDKYVEPYDLRRGMPTFPSRQKGSLDVAGRLGNIAAHKLHEIASMLTHIELPQKGRGKQSFGIIVADHSLATLEGFARERGLDIEAALTECLESYAEHCISVASDHCPKLERFCLGFPRGLAYGLQEEAGSGLKMSEICIKATPGLLFAINMISSAEANCGLIANEAIRHATNGRSLFQCLLELRVEQRRLASDPNRRVSERNEDDFAIDDEAA